MVQILKIKKIFRWITFIFALIWVICLLLYSSRLIGTYIHERMHAENAIGLKAIEVNYDGTGRTIAKDFVNSNNEMHKWIYFNGTIASLSLFLISIFCLMIITMFPITEVDQPKPVKKKQKVIKGIHEILGRK